MSVIEVRGLTKCFGSQVVVDHATFDVESGSVVGFLGPNGAGKTTTLRMVLGLVTPTPPSHCACTAMRWRSGTGRPLR